MRVPRTVTSLSGGSVGFNMTPLIDMVFLLIIFFLVATFYVQRGVNQPINLPAADTADPQKNNDDKRLIITVTEQGEYWIGGTKLEFGDVALEISNFAERHQKSLNANSVVIRGDINVDFKFIKPLIVECAERRIPFFSFAADKK